MSKEGALAPKEQGTVTGQTETMDTTTINFHKPRDVAWVLAYVVPNPRRRGTWLSSPREQGKIEINYAREFKVGAQQRT